MRRIVLSLAGGCALSTLVTSLLILPLPAAAERATVKSDMPDPGESIEIAASTSVTSLPLSDRQGWPVNLHAPGAGFPYTPTLFDVDGDGAAEIFMTGGETFGLRGDGTFLPGWPTTEHLYMGYGTNEQKPGPSAADLEGDGDVEVMWSERDWWAGSSRMWCFNGREPTGVNMPGLPQFAPDDYSNALDVPFVLGDADGDGDLEAWGPHTLGNNFVHYRISAFDHLGSRLFTRDLGSGENILDLCFGDIDGNGSEEFVATTWEDPSLRLYVFTADGGDAAGYPVLLGNFTGGYLMFGPPVPVDMDGDGDLEFLIGYNMGGTSRAHARHHDGFPVAGYPVTIATQSQLYYLAVGDLTGDGMPELVALDNYLPGTNRALAFNLITGVPLPGWPVFVNDWPHGFPCVADVDGDGLQDVCISTQGGEVYAIGSTGTVLPGYPKTMLGPSVSGVAAGDIDGDGLFELVAATWDGWVHAWDTTGPALPGRADWPMRGIDARNTGVFRRGNVVGVGTGSGLPIVTRLRVTPNPMRVGTEFRLTGGRDGMRVEILDVVGRRVDVLTLREERAVWRVDGVLPAGVYFLRPMDDPDVPGSRLVLMP